MKTTTLKYCRHPSFRKILNCLQNILTHFEQTSSSHQSRHCSHTMEPVCQAKILLMIRDGWPHQNGWILGKIPNGLWPPPPHFWKIILRISRQKCVCSLWWDCCVLYDPISHEMHVVQQFNMVIGWKHTLKPPFCIIFMLKKAYLKVQNLQYKFLD